MDFLPHDGSYFDDLRADDDRHEASKRKKRAIAGVDDDLLGFFQNVRSRPWATIYVKNQTVADGVLRLLETWHSHGMIPMANAIYFDPSLRVADIRVSS